MRGAPINQVPAIQMNANIIAVLACPSALSRPNMGVEVGTNKLANQSSRKYGFATSHLSPNTNTVNGSNRAKIRSASGAQMALVDQTTRSTNSPKCCRSDCRRENAGK